MRKYFYVIGQKKQEDNVLLAHKLRGSSSILEGEYQIEENLFKAY
ncbi:hypothetical protein P4H08_16070 [Bacillus cereus]|nr:hypothetical protein [Bacillus cereus]MDA1935590.1 hypothetical protein [Bacillus cereus]MDA1941495.1 hypothetical protein [Bacillus cereus]MEB8674806.1 hypothetical protein [Bacillus cereus]MEB8692987.1 hypothetical protein [Bacillus cereus]